VEAGPQAVGGEQERVGGRVRLALEASDRVASHNYGVRSTETLSEAAFRLHPEVQRRRWKYRDAQRGCLQTSSRSSTTALEVPRRSARLPSDSIQKFNDGVGSTETLSKAAFRLHPEVGSKTRQHKIKWMRYELFKTLITHTLYYCHSVSICTGAFPVKAK
jgi:hypothetical protein